MFIWQWTQNQWCGNKYVDASRTVKYVFQWLWTLLENTKSCHDDTYTTLLWEAGPTLQYSANHNAQSWSRAHSPPAECGVSIVTERVLLEAPVERVPQIILPPSTCSTASSDSLKKTLSFRKSYALLYSICCCFLIYKMWKYNLIIVLDLILE